MKQKTTSFISSSVSTEETVPLPVSCMSNGSRPAATIQWTIGQTDVTLYSTTDKTHVTDDDAYTLISTLTYNVDRTYNGETITCKAHVSVTYKHIMMLYVLNRCSDSVPDTFMIYVVIELHL